MNLYRMEFLAHSASGQAKDDILAMVLDRATGLTIVRKYSAKPVARGIVSLRIDFLAEGDNEAQRTGQSVLRTVQYATRGADSLTVKRLKTDV